MLLARERLGLYAEKAREPHIDILGATLTHGASARTGKHSILLTSPTQRKVVAVDRRIVEGLTGALMLEPCSGGLPERSLVVADKLNPAGDVQETCGDHASRVAVVNVADLVRPTVGVHASYLAAIAEYQAEGGYPDFDDLDVSDPADFHTYVEQLCRDPRSAPALDWPEMTLLWWIDGYEYLGRLSIWHCLAGPAASSGHIGYDIRPRARGRGHAAAMLAAALPIIATLGIDPAVATVRVGNPASQRVLEAAGAQLVRADGNRLYFHLPTGRR